MFVWRHGGGQVHICGSFNNWQERVMMERVPGHDHEFRLQLSLAAGEYQYKYIVDGHWRCADDQEKVRDRHGNENNKVVIKVPEPQPVVQ